MFGVHFHWFLLRVLLSHHFGSENYRVRTGDHGLVLKYAYDYDARAQLYDVC